MLSHNAPTSFRIAIVAVAVLFITVHSWGSETPAAPSPRISLEQLIAAHSECVKAELRSVETRRRLAEQHAASIQELYKAGHASWMEQSHAESERLQLRARVSATSTMLEWLTKEHQLATTQPKSMDKASLLIHLPESRVPVGWLTYSSTINPSTIAALKSAFHSRTSEAELKKSQFLVTQATRTFERLQASATTSEEELSLAKHQLEAAIAEQQHLDAQARLHELHLKLINQIASEPPTQESSLTASAKESLNSTSLVNRSFMQFIDEENNAGPIWEIQAINEWFRSTTEATLRLQREGFASAREVALKWDQRNGLGRSLVFQEELHSWKQQWTDSRLTDLRPAVERSISSTLSPDAPQIADICDLGVFEFAIQSQREYLQLKADSEAMKHRMRQCQMLIERLRSQTVPNPAELEQAQNLLALLEAQSKSTIGQTAISAAIIERLPQLSTATRCGSNLELLDPPTMEVLLRVESHAHEQANPRHLDASQRSAERHIRAIHALRDKGFASVEEVQSAELNLLDVKAQRTAAQDNLDRHRHRQMVFGDLQKELEKAP